MKKALVVSDLHCHEWPEYATRTSDGTPQRLLDGLSIMYQATDYMVQHNIKYGFFAGDFFHLHEKVLVSVATALSVWAERAFIRGHNWVFMTGNHDWDLLGLYHALEPFKKHIGVVSFPKLFSCELGLFALIPWLHKGSDFGKATHEVLNQGPVVTFLHHDMADVKYRGRFIGRSGTLRSLRSTYALSGHYHDRDVVTPWFQYIGAPMHHNWGDVGQKRGMLELNLEGKNPSVTFIPTKCPKFVRIKDTKAVELPEEKLVKKVHGNFVRLTTKNTHSSVYEKACQLIQKCEPRILEPEDLYSVPEDFTQLPEETSSVDFESVVEEYVEQSESSLNKPLLKKIGQKAVREAV